MRWGLWVWIDLDSSLNYWTEKAWEELTVSSFVVVLLKVVESCWVYLEEGGIFLKGVVPFRSVAF